MQIYGKKRKVYHKFIQKAQKSRKNRSLSVISVLSLREIGSLQYVYERRLFAWSDSTSGARVSTCAAVNTCVGINYILAITFADSTRWTLASASSTHYTIVANYVSHNLYSFWFVFRIIVCSIFVANVGKVFIIYQILGRENRIFSRK